MFCVWKSCIFAKVSRFCVFCAGSHERCFLQRCNRVGRYLRQAMPRNRVEREDTSYGERRAMEHHQFSSLGLLRFGGPTRQKTRQEIGDPQRGPSTIHAKKTAGLQRKAPEGNVPEVLSRDPPGQYIIQGRGLSRHIPGRGLSRMSRVSRHIPGRLVPGFRPGSRLGRCPRIPRDSRDKPVPGYAGTSFYIYI